MGGALRVAAFVALTFTPSCMHSPVSIHAGDVLAGSRAEGAVLLASSTMTVPSSVIEMPPLYVDARERYAQRIRHASAHATALCGREWRCPAVHVRRADLYRRADGTTWTVVRLSACGEEHVYERARAGWTEATWRLR